VTQPLVSEGNAAPREDRGSLSPGVWMPSLLGATPTIAAVAAALYYGTHWLTVFQLPVDFQWVTGVVAVIVLALVFAVVAIAAELRRWNMRRLIHEIEVGDRRIDQNLSDISQGLRRLEAMGVLDARNGDG
jgi:hypothetical protein